MNEMTEKIALVERDLATSKGPLNLFAVLEREDVVGRWDVVVSASWAKQDKETLKDIADAIRRHLSPSDMTNLARIVVLLPGDEPVRSLNDKYDVEHARIELDEPERFGLPATHGYIVTSRSAA